jgi:hypothetical protein
MIPEKDEFKVYLNDSYTTETPPRPEVLVKAAVT